MRRLYLSIFLFLTSFIIRAEVKLSAECSNCFFEKRGMGNFSPSYTYVGGPNKKAFQDNPVNSVVRQVIANAGESQDLKIKEVIDSLGESGKLSHEQMEALYEQLLVQTNLPYSQNTSNNSSGIELVEYPAHRNIRAALKNSLAMESPRIRALLKASELFYDSQDMKALSKHLLENFSGSELSRIGIQFFNNGMINTYDKLELLETILKGEPSDGSVVNIIRTLIQMDSFKTLPKEFRELVSEHIEILQGANGPNGSYLCEVGSNLYAFSSKKKQVEDERMISNLDPNDPNYDKLVREIKDEPSSAHSVPIEVATSNKEMWLDQLELLSELGFNFKSKCENGLSVFEMLNQLVDEGQIYQPSFLYDLNIDPCIVVGELNLGGLCDVAKVITILREESAWNEDVAKRNEQYDRTIDTTIGVNRGCHINILDSIVVQNYEITNREFEFTIEEKTYRRKNLNSFINELQQVLDRRKKAL